MTTPLSQFGLFQTRWELGIHGPTDGKWRIVCGTQVIAEAGDRRHAGLIICAPQLYEALDAICSSLVQQDDEGLIEHAPQMEAARQVLDRLYKFLLAAPFPAMPQELRPPSPPAGKEREGDSTPTTT